MWEFLTIAIIFFLLGRYTVSQGIKIDQELITNNYQKVRKYIHKKGLRNEVGLVESLSKEESAKLDTNVEKEEQEMEVFFNKWDNKE